MSAATATVRMTPEQFFRNWLVHEECLTAKECDVAKLLMRGYGVIEIATKLGMSRNTVGAHKTVIFGKMDVSSTGELAAELWLGFCEEFAAYTK